MTALSQVFLLGISGGIVPCPEGLAVFLASIAGFVGKLATGQVVGLLALAVAVGAVVGAQVGSAVSLRTRPQWLRWVMAAVVTTMAVGIGVDAITAY